MFTQEQEAAFQKEMDGIATDTQAQTAKSEDKAEKQSQEPAEVENDELELVDTDDDVEVAESEIEEPEVDAETDLEDETSSDDEVEAEETEVDATDTDDQVIDKKAQSKDVRKSIARIQAQHKAELAERDARLARLEQAITQNSTPPNTSQQNNAQPVDLTAQRQKRVDEMVAEGFTPEFAAQTVVYEEKQAHKRQQEESQNKALQAQTRLQEQLNQARTKVEQAVNADPELKTLGINYRGVKLTESMQMALGQLDRPGRTLKHILKNDPNYIERMALRDGSEQYAQILILGGKLEAQREIQKLKSNKPSVKPNPVGKVGSRGQKSEGDDPMRWSASKLHKEMGLA